MKGREGCGEGTEVGTWDGCGVGVGVGNFVG